MKKFRLYYCALFICITVLFTACDNDDKVYNGLDVSETNKIYTNKSASISTTNQLVLSYNSNVLTAKDVYFELINGERADLKLKYILPGEKETLLENVPLIALEKEGYSFSGQSTTETGITFSYKGSIVPGILTLSLTDVKLADNIFSAQGKWYNTKTALTWQVSNSGQLNGILWGVATGLISNLLDNLLLSVLHDITFDADGNVTASFAPLPEEANIAAFLTGSNNYNDRDISDWKTSPVNMAFYYIKDGKLYVYPEVEMIMKNLLGDFSRADTNLKEIFDVVVDLLYLIIQWCNEGIEFSVAENGNNITLTMDKSQIEPVFPLLPYLVDYLPMDAVMEYLPAEFEGVLEELLNEAATKTTNFELKVTLSKQK